MCVYHYSYVSTCCHAEFTRISYCNNAIALGLPRNHSPDDQSADNNLNDKPDAQSGSSAHTPVSSANNGSSSHSQLPSHTQQQHQSQYNDNMSIIKPSESGHASTWDVVVQERDVQSHHQAAFIPRSALIDGPRQQQNSLSDASPVLDRQSYSDVDIDMPLNTQSSLHMKVTHDGKVPELFARFESCSGHSNAREGSHDESVDSTTDLDTIAMHHQEQADYRYAAHTVGAAGHSPRKSIPTQWLLKSTGPNLATAQRAKARTSKNSWDSDSPDEVKTLRETRSSTDLRRTHSKEGALYLTKEALAAVDSTIASPTSPLSPSRLHGSPTKRPWNSPTGPLRSSVRQQNLSFRTSPSKSTHLSTESISAAHSRAPSSVATSTGRMSFHTAEGSPVRSSASTEHSFQSAAENPEDLDVPDFDLKANIDDEQMHHDSSSSRSTTAKGNTEGKRSSLTPKLALQIPPTVSCHDLHRDSSSAPTVAPSGSYMLRSPQSPVSPTQMSRIPRVGATSKIAVPLRNSTVQRVESVKSLQCKLKTLQAMQSDASKVPLPETPKPLPASLRHVRTVDSTGSTPIISRTSELHGDDQTLDTVFKAEQKRLAHVDSPMSAPNIEVSGLPKNISQCGASFVHVNNCTVDHEASYKTVKPENMSWDAPPAFTHGTTLTCSTSIPAIVVMMAHNLDAENTNIEVKQEEPVSASTDDIDDSVRNVTSVRGRSEWYVPDEGKQGDSGCSTQSSVGSLRATAAEFVPQASSIAGPIEATTRTVPPVSFHDIVGLPDATVLDRNGIPFLWYMYGVQFAYEQGYRNGRPKSPKKFKQSRKQRTSLSSPVDPPHPSSKAVPIMTPRPATPRSAAANQRSNSTELMPPPPLLTTRRREETRQENCHPASNREVSIPHNANAGANRPFENQLNMISKQAALNSHSNSNAPRHFNVDLTTVRNVGFPSGPRNMYPPSYYTVPRHGHRNNRGNGLYGGRGSAGVPIDATAPFPNPVPPQGRPDQGQTYGAHPFDYSGYTIGNESCGLVNITVATERGGGEPCNACAPDH
ncbi:hypothetical protein AA0119_g10235 [Alternaria tenuissima]|uniref:Uncharacterized protein n=1 Tax=Alternaria tenuissima TaxID=119927 RepID=A0ABY0FXK2_9PLEO|nr:hypothetical protein AA0119_g10235 [Alternaria tenuissima]RYO05903.1 hypothetical protein AA0121_g12268 [Alternaria tenuissima]RYO68543.1 hypothetical protein AA0116_g1110 [Alternaria tenuissima]